MAFRLTYRTMAEEGYTVRAYCALPCGHNSELDIKMLALQYGDGDETAGHINTRLRCTVCGKRRGTIRIGLPAVWKRPALKG